jgi:DHA2 family multidrug resistance protein
MKYYKWIATFIIMIGTFMALLDTTIVDITLPKMIAELNTDTKGIEWVVIAYFIGSAIAMTTVGWLGDRIGHNNAYILGMVIFTISSALCGQSVNIDQMEAFRFIQGLGEGLIIPISMTILYEIFPEDERGLSIGIYGLGASFAPALGPTLGGYITEHLSWRWIFYVNIPTGIIGIFLSLILLKESGKRKSSSFDIIGFILMSIMFSSLIIFLSKGQEKEWLRSDFILYMIATYIVSTVGFIGWELNRKEPLVDLRLFKYPNLMLSVLILSLFGMSLYGCFFMLPLYMQRLRLYPTLTSGLILFPGAMIGVFSTIAGGILSDRYNPKYILLSGLTLVIISVFRFSYYDLYTSKFIIVIDFIIFNLGIGLIFPPVITIGLNSISLESVNMGSSIQNVCRLVAGSIGTSIATTILIRRGEYYLDHFLSKLTYSNIEGIFIRQKLYSYLYLQGTPEPLIRARSLALLNGYVIQHAKSYAFQVVFIYLTVFVILTILLIPFIKYIKIEKKKDLAIH